MALTDVTAHRFGAADVMTTFCALHDEFENTVVGFFAAAQNWIQARIS